MNTVLFFTAAMITGLCVAAASAADLKVIANRSVGASSVSADELKGVFEAFAKEYLGKTDAALQTYYRSLVFGVSAAIAGVNSLEVK